MVEGDGRDTRAMKPRSIGVPIVSLVLSALLFAMTFMMDARPPKELQFVSGVIADREPLYTRGQLIGFRILVGHPTVTLTYRDPDPEVEQAWSMVQTARAASVRFDAQSGRKPILWELEVDGQPIATLAKLETIRGRWFWLHFWIAALAGGIGLVSMRSWLRARRQLRRRR